MLAKAAISFESESIGRSSAPSRISAPPTFTERVEL